MNLNPCKQFYQLNKNFLKLQKKNLFRAQQKIEEKQNETKEEDKLKNSDFFLAPDN